ncbi:hypothetical protein COU57_03285 [Candidatus Pacearchaeota archaeon CG10_big_fil_rev_8_21_14_0_10_32_14]|nr:MAG: hypothetical protein COU57_03285 [Candidatus Pacearchaeota archaeon CG10_big_fil_rev_8_21_14_0_10_32_14]
MEINQNPIRILLFYKFVKLSENDVDWFIRTHKKFCEDIGIKGRILVACEGINGSVSGTATEMEKYKIALRNDERFSDIRFKEEMGIIHPFTKMKILKREEIVSIKFDVDMSKAGQFITAEELYDWYEKGLFEKGDAIIFDTRNDYEFKVGHFKNSIQVNTKTFREFPNALKNFEHLKGKKIVTFCTGGIRCEKASAVMREFGFENVFQLKDGIINFIQKFPNTYWEGKCFVFDKRMVSDVSPSSENKPITNCEVCGIVCDLYKNCRNPSCDRFVVECLECQEKLNGCCSEHCLEELNIHFKEKSLRNQGRKEKIVLEM